MPHRRIGLSAMPMALTGRDMRDIAHVDLALFVLRRHHAGARGHDQDLVAAMGVPARRATLAEIYDAAVVVRGIAGLDDGLTRPGNRAGPTFDPLGAFDWDVRDVFERDDLHVTVSSC